MRDEDDSDTPDLQLGDHAKQPLDFAVTQRGRRLIHDQDPRVGTEGPRDLHELLLGHRQRAHLAKRVDRRADAFEQGAGPRMPLFPPHGSPGAPFEPDGDVFGNRQIRKKRWLLIDRGDTQLLRAERVQVLNHLILDPDRSLVGNMGAGDHLDERRLARAVFADQGVHLAGRRSNDTRLSASTPANALLIELSSSNVDKTRFPRPSSLAQPRFESTSRSYACTSASHSLPAGTPCVRQ